MLALLNFATLVQTMGTAVLGRASAVIDLTVGSVARTILEANASVALWLQWLILQVLSMTRLSTSTGTNVDSWVGDFGMSRIPAVAASGQVTFSSYTTSQQRLIVPGVSVKTADGTQIFTVVADTTNAAWSAAQGGFVVAAGVASVTVTVQASVAGAAGNVQAGAIALIASAISGIDTVTNAASFTNGIDAETDAALKARFANYIASLSKATLPAVEYAISSVQQGLSYSVTENSTLGGVYEPGHFLVVVDDGSGAPPSTLLSTVYAAVDQMRPIGSTFEVHGPTLVGCTIGLTISVSVGASKPAIIGPVAQAIQSYVDALPIGGTLYLTRVVQIAYDTNSAITNVSAVTINSATSDLNPGPAGVVRVTGGLAGVTVS